MPRPSRRGPGRSGTKPRTGRGSCWSTKRRPPSHDRPLDRADPADDGHEDHLRRPLDAEGRGRLDAELADGDQRPGRAAPRRGDQVHDPLGPRAPARPRSRAPTSLSRTAVSTRPEPAAQRPGTSRPSASDDHRERRPVRLGAEHRRVAAVQAAGTPAPVPAAERLRTRLTRSWNMSATTHVAMAKYPPRRRNSSSEIGTASTAHRERRDRDRHERLDAVLARRYSTM